LTSGQDVRGRVTFLSRSADALTRTFRVEVTVDNDDLAISDGQTAEILVAADGQVAHLIAQSSLTLDDDGILGVRTVGEGNIARFMPVTLLRDTAQGVWVTDLPVAVDIITVGQEFVIDGVHLTATFTEAKE
jgi:multidrug efflux system membrane fusion protein